MFDRWSGPIIVRNPSQDKRVAAASTPKRFILTGTPGAGKTSILLALKARGYDVVTEAATDVVARHLASGSAHPPMRESFIDEIVALQRERQEKTVRDGTCIQVFDRSPICTIALSVYAGQPVSAVLTAEVDRVIAEQVYERQVFFVRSIGFCEPTAVRRISFESSLRFERIHEDTYRAFGYDLIEVPPSELATRVDAITRALGAPG